MTSLREWRTFLLFVGPGRSGTTLVRTLLDGHPQVLMGQEVHVLKRLEEGEGLAAILARIRLAAERFRRDPTWNAYRYEMPVSPADGGLRVIGDNKAAGTLARLRRNPGLLDRLRETLPVPLRVLHCVRCPLDSVASKASNRGDALEAAARRHLRAEDEAAALEGVLGADLRRLYLEDLVGRPEGVLAEVCAFLDVPMEPRWAAACRGLLFDRPVLTRKRVAWTPEVLDLLRQGTRRLPHLARYREEVP